MTTTDACAGKPKFTLEQTMRGWADVLKLWRLCQNGKCRRANSCCGNPRACWPLNFPLLPEDVRAWFGALDEAQEAGLSVDEAFERLDHSTEGDAFLDWCKAVQESLPGKRRTRQ